MAIIGTGRMTDYKSEINVPWYDYIEKGYDINKIIIEDGVAGIGSYAFSACKNFTSISIPDSVTSIGFYAFYDTAYYNDKTNWENGVLYINNALISAKHDVSGDYSIKNGTVCISNGAFNGLLNLTSISIPDSVSSIGDYAFYGCKRLTNISIPNSVSSIGDEAFYDCTGLTTATYNGSPEDITIGSENSCLTNVLIYLKGSCGTNLTYYFDHEVGELTISGTGRMTDYESANSTPWNDLVGKGYDINKIIVENGVASIGSYAFSACKGLTAVNLPKTIKMIYSSAFQGCDMLRDVYYSGSEEDWSKIGINTTGNDNLTVFATIHYNSSTDPEIPDTEGKTPQIGSTTFTFTPIGVKEGNIIAILVVKDGVSTSYAKTYSGSGPVTFEIENGFNSIKVLAWDSYGSMHALMDYATIE